MAIYHLTTKVFSRGKGQSAIAAAAYRSGERLFDEAAGEQKLYRLRSDRILFEGLFVPGNAPAWSQDRNAFWNRAEQAEPRKDARLAREIEIALPHELTDQQRQWLVADFVREAFVRKGYAVDVAIHIPDRQSDERNHHAHLLIAERKLGSEGFAKLKDPWMNSKEQLALWREQWANLANRHLERHGHDARVDHRSLKDQGVDRDPTLHVGLAANALAARGAQSDRVDAFNDIVERNEIRVELREINADLAHLTRLADAEASPRSGPQTVRPAPARNRDMEPPSEDILHQQVDRELYRLNELKRLDEMARAAREAQRVSEHEERSRAFHREKELEAEEAKKKTAENTSAEDRKAKEGDISSASARYAIALGENYNVHDPYGSLARSAMSESAMFHRNQEKLREQMAKEADPEKRKVIELRKKIEGCEYMAITSERLAGISQTITGQKDNPQSVKDRARAEEYQALAKSLRSERNALIEANEKHNQATLEKTKGLNGQQRPANTAYDLRREQSASPTPSPASQSQNRADRQPERPAAAQAEAVNIQSESVRPSQRHADLKREQSTAQQTSPEPLQKQAAPAQVYEEGPSRPKPKARTGAEAPPREASKPAGGKTAERELHVVDETTGRTSKLTDFVRDLPKEPAQQRSVDIKAFVTDPEARKKQAFERLDDMKRAKDCDLAVGRIREDLEVGRPIKAADIKRLSRDHHETIGKRGDEGLRQVVREETQKTQGKGTGRGRRED